MEILKEFQDLIPPLTNEEYKQLEKTITLLMVTIDTR
jgi:hypothetical protein